MKRSMIVMALGALVSLMLVGPVLAASPGNDTYAGRTMVGALPFTDAIDTTQATTDALDTEVNADCGAPATDASVWYELTPDADAEILIDTSGSDYTVGTLLLTGAPGSFTAQACVAGSVTFSATAGQTLTIFLFDFDEIGNGGNLSLSITELPPPPSLEVTIDRSGTVNQRTGIATVKGTITCTGGDESGKYFLEGQLTQSVGRFLIQASGGGSGFACDGTAEAWSIELVGQNGRLSGGKATVSIFAFACMFSCSSVEKTQVITLKR